MLHVDNHLILLCTSKELNKEPRVNGFWEIDHVEIVQVFTNVSADGLPSKETTWWGVRNPVSTDGVRDGHSVQVGSVHGDYGKPDVPIVRLESTLGHNEVASAACAALILSGDASFATKPSGVTSQVGAWAGFRWVKLTRGLVHIQSNSATPYIVQVNMEMVVTVDNIGKGYQNAVV